MLREKTKINKHVEKKIKKPTRGNVFPIRTKQVDHVTYEALNQD